MFGFLRKKKAEYPFDEPNAHIPLANTLATEMADRDLNLSASVLHDHYFILIYGRERIALATSVPKDDPSIVSWAKISDVPEFRSYVMSDFDKEMGFIPMDIEGVAAKLLKRAKENFKSAAR